MKVSELAHILQVTPDTVRFYTRAGFLKPSKSIVNGYKAYSLQDKERLRFIISARQLGFSVNDIREILSEADDGKTACPMVRDIIERRLAETEQQFQQTLALRNKMRAAINNWQQKPDKMPTSNMVCHLIEEPGANYNKENQDES